MIEGQLITFMVAIAILTLSPGADTVMVTRNALRGGFKDGVITSFGICLGLFVHAAISGGGLALLLMGPCDYFALVKLAGALYLIWLGAQSLISGVRGTAASSPLDQGMRPVSALRSLREGFLSNTLNPKTAVFYMAFLPQFIDPQGDLFWQAQRLAGVHFILAMAWQCVIAAMVDKAKQILTRPQVLRGFNSVIGVMLIGFGLTLGSGF
ncbi:MAG: LysE family translocator [Alphaproteobacteria bacterium]|nr:LysE family translocator [Alphaproteobacteria bacterium]